MNECPFKHQRISPFEGCVCSALPAVFWNLLTKAGLSLGLGGWDYFEVCLPAMIDSLNLKTYRVFCGKKTAIHLRLVDATASPIWVTFRASGKVSKISPFLMGNETAFRMPVAEARWTVQFCMGWCQFPWPHTNSECEVPSQLIHQTLVVRVCFGGSRDMARGRVKSTLKAYICYTF